MFVVYSAEGRNFIGEAPNRQLERVNKISPTEKIAFDEKMLEFDEDTPQRARHQKNHYALSQYQKQLDGAQDRHAVVVAVSEIMSSPVISLPPEATLAEVWALMQERGIQHVPVVDDGALVGICSLQALLRQVIINQENKIETAVDRSLIEIATEEVVTTLPNVDVRRVAFIMTQYRIGSLPVMSESGELVGIITRSDLIKRLSKLPPLEIYA